MCARQWSANTKAEESKGGVRLLGWDVSGLGSNQRFVLLVGLSIALNLAYGTMQEYIVVHVFQRRLALFMSLVQTSSFAVIAHLHRLYMGEAHVRRVPLRWYLLLALAMASTMVLGNLGTQHLNWSTKVLFKSTKAVPMMLWGALFMGKTYKRRTYVCVLVMVTGLVVFLEADARSPAIFSMVGVLLMVACVLVDCFYSNLAELLLRRYDVSSEEVIFYTYALGSMYQFTSALVSGDLMAGVRFFAVEGGWHGAPVLVAYTLAGYLGSSCATAVTKNYGALTSTLASATRKALNLLFSFALFPKPFTGLHMVGITLFMVGLVAKSASHKRAHGSGGASPAPLLPLAAAPTAGHKGELLVRCSAAPLEVDGGDTAPPSACSPGEMSPDRPLLPPPKHGVPNSPVAAVVAGYGLLRGAAAMPFMRMRRAASGGGAVASAAAAAADAAAFAV